MTKRGAYSTSNPRVVPVGREQIRVVADELTERILKGLNAPDYADEPYPIGTVAMLPDVDMPIVSSFGGPADRRRGEKIRRGPAVTGTSTHALRWNQPSSSYPLATL